MRTIFTLVSVLLVTAGLSGTLVGYVEVSVPLQKIGKVLLVIGCAMLVIVGLIPSTRIALIGARVPPHLVNKEAPKIESDSKGDK